MTFFFVRDAGHKYRFFSTEPVRPIEVRTTRWRRLWEKARDKLMFLPARSLRQEQALARVARLESPSVRILYAARTEERKIRFRFFLFLQKQRTRHILLLCGEALLLPLSGLATIIPGPNVFFGALALIMITHWNALRGLYRLARKRHDLEASELLGEWEDAVEARAEASFPALLDRLEAAFGLAGLRKVLWPPRKKTPVPSDPAV
jgi:hypothetical protein